MSELITPYVRFLDLHIHKMVARDMNQRTVSLHRFVELTCAHTSARRSLCVRPEANAKLACERNRGWPQNKKIEHGTPDQRMANGHNFPTVCGHPQRHLSYSTLQKTFNHIKPFAKGCRSPCYLKCLTMRRRMNPLALFIYDALCVAIHQQRHFSSTKHLRIQLIEELRYLYCHQ